jgi:four helix bundle protein
MSDQQQVQTSRKFDLEQRLINFAVEIIAISENTDKTKAGFHISGQLLRSGSAPALYYGEAQGAESRADFLHKMKIILKELRETRISLIIIKTVPLTQDFNKVDNTIKECSELISIVRKSCETVRKNMENQKK